MSKKHRDEDYPNIEDHGIIGDRRTAALVGLDGTINFLCLPRFDSPSVFAALLDAKRGGRFALCPVEEPSRRQQMYLPETNVLLTRFLSHDGVVEVVDFMAPAPVYDTQALIRIVRGVRGETRMRMRLEPRFDYARASATIEQSGSTWVLAADDEDCPTPPLRLRTAAAIEAKRERRPPALVAEFTIGDDEHLAFVLEPAECDESSPFTSAESVAAALERTIEFWHDWCANIHYRGRWSEMVLRSALVLELLTSHETGAIVAAPTFGIPEKIGGDSNWDYRYCWIRDTSFAMQALTRLGLHDDAKALVRWLEERCCDAPEHMPIEVLYDITGERAPKEIELDSLRGYRGSTPVRIGNGAADQLQLDIAGELLNALYTHDPGGTSIPHDSWGTIVELLDDLGERWAEPDHGIWELRGRPRHRLHSRVLCWVAFDRGLRLARGHGRPAPLERWEATRDAIYEDIWARFWDDDFDAFTGVADSRSLDAASLLMPLHGFISSSDRRWRTMLDTVDEHMVDDSLVYRLVPPDNGFSGTFSLCTFWYVECLVHADRLHEARNVFEKILSHSNHLGLYAEHLGACGEHLGNFPQVLTHLGLINAACALDAGLDAESPGRRGRERE
jgi:GH15 family glucan-1,4-alpha-glucosidase